MAFSIKKFIHGPEFQKSAVIGQPTVLEAELAFEVSTTKTWAAFSRLFGLEGHRKFGLSSAFSNARSGNNCRLPPYKSKKVNNAQNDFIKKVEIKSQEDKKKKIQEGLWKTFGWFVIIRSTRIRGKNVRQNVSNR